MTTYTILDSLIWGFIASIPLLIGSIVALFVNLPKNIIASIMAFGSGVLITALAFSLIEESFSLAQSIPPVITGFIGGGLSYTIANYFLNKKTLGNIRKRSHGEDAGGRKNASGLAFLVGSVTDNIPENMAFRILLVTGGAVQ